MLLSCGRRGAAPLILQPKQYESEERNENIHVEDHPGVARREIVGRHHLFDMAKGGAEGENAGADDRYEAALKIGKGCNESGQREAKARRADLELEGTVRPADECGRHRAKEHMEDEVHEKRDADVEKHIPDKELVDNDGSTDGSWCACNRDPRG